MSKIFIKTKEDFICEHCGVAVIGNGYTNHCPRCLYSKHVDIHPGDRLHSCRALMKPIAVEFEKGHYVITHECTRCGAHVRCKNAGGDSTDILITLSVAKI